MSDIRNSQTRHPSLGIELLPDHGMRMPDARDANMWTAGAHAGLAYAADLIRRAKASGQDLDGLLQEVDGAKAIPFEKTRYGYTFECAAIIPRDQQGVSWLAWTVGPREPVTWLEWPPKAAPAKAIGWLSGEDMIGAFYAK